jgi:GST-like protein
VLELYYWTTPNGHKLTMFFEESGLEYVMKPVDISKGEQFTPEFLKIAPNNRIPALVDTEPEGLTHQINIFESGAILLYLAEKYGQFIPQDLFGRVECLKWLFWQMGGLGPMAGQNHHFVQYAPEKVPYAIDRYVRETSRLYGVLNKHLSDGKNYICGDYSIADMAIYPWIVPHEKQLQKIDEFPYLKSWFLRVQSRPGTQRAYALAKTINLAPTVNENSKALLFGQDAKSVK